MGLGQNVLADKFSKRYELDQSDRIVYEGFALPGQGLKDAGVWAVCMYAYTGANTNPDICYWASGTVLFDKTWSLRATYTYS